MADSSYVDFGSLFNVYGNVIINVQNSFFLHMNVILPPGLNSHMVRCFAGCFACLGRALVFMAGYGRSLREFAMCTIFECNYRRHMGLQALGIDSKTTWMWLHLRL